MKKVGNAAKTLGKKLKKTKVGKALKNSASKLRNVFKKKKDRLRDDKRRQQEQRKQNQDQRRKDEKSKESKQSRLDKAVARIRPKIDGLLKFGVPRTALRAALAGMRAWYRLTGLETSGDPGFDVIASLNPEKKANSGKWKEEYGGEGRRKQIEPRTNAQGEKYGEDVLGPITYDRLPGDIQQALLEYTHWSWPWQQISRGVSPEQFLASATERPLLSVFGGRKPKLDDIYEASRRADLSDSDRRLLGAIMKADVPQEKLEDLINLKSGVQLRLEDRFGGTLPTPAQLRDLMRRLDVGVSANRIPDGIQVHRGLSSVDFMRGYHGTPQSLRGTTQVEPGYLSGSLGREAALPGAEGMQNEDEIRRAYPYRLRLDVPPQARAVWMGVRSDYPDQREIIQPRNTKYRIYSVKGPDRPGPSGLWEIRARVILQ